MATPFKVERTVEARMQPYAECLNDDCEWARNMSAMTRDSAKLHAGQTGHSVLVVMETRSYYNGEERVKK